MTLPPACLAAPSQLEIMFGERCNLACDYCFVDKSCAASLNWPSIRRGIDAFWDLPADGATVTMTTSEPLLHPRLFERAVSYLYDRMGRSSKRLSIVATTNGLLLRGRARDFIESLDQRFQLNVSLDGTRSSHDAHRRFARAANSSFELALKNWRAFGAKDSARAILTVAPDQAAALKANVAFLGREGFRSVDVFAQVLTLWRREELGRLDRGLAEAIAAANAGRGPRLRLLNRLWGASHYAKLLLGADARFYLFEWVLPLPYERRRPFTVGSARRGIDLDARRGLFEGLFDELLRRGGGRCLRCRYRELCALPLPLYLRARDRGEDFERQLDNFCAVARLFIERSRTIALDARNPLDSGKLRRLWGRPQQGALGLLAAPRGLGDQALEAVQASEIEQPPRPRQQPGEGQVHRRRQGRAAPHAKRPQAKVDAGGLRLPSGALQLFVDSPQRTPLKGAQRRRQPARRRRVPQAP
ncbi:MAG: radical SAM protein [Elusimicrobia bacterium]|nr:radical SAM protein [Elusimicrobiota bacterium]MDE2236353.1 radical SAM protein [Elusimicrobiota bacterium]MDE2425162.1 radical SAM protein [Elusimicrobiota bacterium]